MIEAVGPLLISDQNPLARGQVLEAEVEVLEGELVGVAELELDLVEHRFIHVARHADPGATELDVVLRVLVRVAALEDVDGRVGLGEVPVVEVDPPEQLHAGAAAAEGRGDLQLLAEGVDLGLKVGQARGRVLGRCGGLVGSLVLGACHLRKQGHGGRDEEERCGAQLHA